MTDTSSASDATSFVRDAMLPQQTPPVTERGVIKWLRENLFAGPFNTALTLAAIWVLWSVINAALPWLMHSVWNAKSLGECRAIIAASSGDGASGACWAVIRDRWPQWLFGFYPVDVKLLANTFYSAQLAAAGGVEKVLADNVNAQVRQAFIDGMRTDIGALTFYIIGYWRPILALLLMLVAIAPVLFARVPRQVLWFTLVFPAVCFFLLWGGSVWGPVVTMLGFVVMMIVYRVGLPVIGVTGAASAGVVAAILWWLYLDGPVASAVASVLPWGLPSIRSDNFGGFLLAITIGVTAIGFSLPLGILLALGRQSNMFIVKTLSVGFIEFIRGVPLITLLFTASLLLQYFLPPGTSFDIILRVIILVTLFASAYIAEVIRGGLAALPRGQYEAADALGLDYWRAQRLIIMPQALKISIPGIVSSFIGLFKDTTLVSFVGLLDPLRGVTAAVRADINWKGIYWEPYIFVGTIFFIICFSMSRYSMYLERKLKTDHR
jgi:general L-amino acid transport system permease protein